MVRHKNNFLIFGYYFRQVELSFSLSSFFLNLIVAWRLETTPSLSRNGGLCENRCTLFVIYCKLFDHGAQTTGRWYAFLFHIAGKWDKIYNLIFLFPCIISTLVCCTRRRSFLSDVSKFWIYCWIRKLLFRWQIPFSSRG